MRKSASFAAIVPLALALAACGGQSSDDSAASGTADSAAAPTGAASAAASATATATLAAGEKPAAFAVCGTCHSTEKGKHGVGPSLAGIYGTRAGDIPGFKFSDGLKASGVTWDDATLDKWLENPTKMVPGTRMVTVVPDP